MAQQSKTQIYLKVKKPLIERQRRARINNCLNALKTLVAELQADEAVLRMDKAELLEQTLAFVRKQSVNKKRGSEPVSADHFRHGYMNAVNEVSRVMASTPGMNVGMGKAVMIHLGRSYNRLQNQQQTQEQQQQLTVQQQQQVSHQQSKHERMQSPLHIECPPPLPPMSPASSGYHSDYESPAASPVAHKQNSVAENLWRPW